MDVSGLSPGYPLTLEPPLYICIHLVWHSTEVVAYISLPALPFFSSLLASAVSSHPSIEETLSARLSKLENYGFDQLVSQVKSSLGSGEPVCPDGTFAAGYTRDAWEKWQIVCLAALSVEDAEDIYLFGTMITGILLIGLGFTLGYRKIRKTGTAVQSLTRLPVLIEAVGRAVNASCRRACCRPRRASCRPQVVQEVDEAALTWETLRCWSLLFLRRRREQLRSFPGGGPGGESFVSFRFCLVRTDNTAAVSYINRLGGIRSHRMSPAISSSGVTRSSSHCALSTSRGSSIVQLMHSHDSLHPPEGGDSIPRRSG